MNKVMKVMELLKTINANKKSLYGVLLLLRNIPEYSKEWRSFSVFCARRVQHLMTKQSISALDISDRYSRGAATDKELSDALHVATIASYNSCKFFNDNFIGAASEFGGSEYHSAKAAANAAQAAESACLPIIFDGDADYDSPLRTSMYAQDAVASAAIKISAARLNEIRDKLDWSAIIYEKTNEIRFPPETIEMREQYNRLREICEHIIQQETIRPRP